MNNIKKHLKGCRQGIVWWLSTVLIPSLPSKNLRYYGYKFLGMQLADNVKFYAGTHVRNCRGISIEDGVNIGPKVLLDGRMGLHIGKCAVIAYEAIIWTLNHDYNDENFKGKGAPVEIGAYSWICSRSIILPGLTIGEGAVVASGAIVTKDVPPYSIVAGIPAKIIGKRERKEWVYGYRKSKDFDHFYA